MHGNLEEVKWLSVRWCNSQRPFPACPFDPKNYALKQWFQILILHQSPVSLCKMAAKAPAWRCWFKLTRGRTQDLCFKEPFQATLLYRRHTPRAPTITWTCQNLHPNCQAAGCLGYFRKQIPRVGITLSEGGLLSTPRIHEEIGQHCWTTRAAGKSIRASVISTPRPLVRGIRIPPQPSS